MSEAEKLKVLKRKRSSIKGRLTIFKNYVTSFSQSEEISKREFSELRVRLVKFEPLLLEFEGIQSDIENLIDNIEQELNERCEFEEQYYMLLTTAQDLIDSENKRNAIKDPDPSSNLVDSKEVKKNVNSSSKLLDKKIESMKSSEYSPNVKLPQISLPKFEGGYDKWLEYRDTFNSLINQNDSLTEINKFHYLRSSLEGSAALVIKSVEFSSSNYETAWQMLCDRYDNKKQLINNHLKTLLKFENIKKESDKSLRALVDHITKHLTCLSNLGEPTENWDTLIIFMFAAKLDSVTYRKWEEHKGTVSDMPTLEMFLQFLRNYADILETFQSNKTENVDTNYKPIKRFEKPQNKSFVAAMHEYKDQCPICNAEHRIYQCKRFLDMTPEQRNSEVCKNKLCINCLRSGHYAPQCKLGPCKACNRKHNSLLHVQKTNKQTQQDTQSQIDSSTQETITNPVALSSTSHERGQVLLSTALVHISVLDKQGGKQLTARALLDCGSQSSFITQSFVKKHGLHIQAAKPINVLGINSMNFQCSMRCDVNVKSVDNNQFAQNVNCIVVPQITSDLPTRQVDVNCISIPPNIKLADPTFHTPSEIDLLLGSDVFWDIIETNKIALGKGQPYLQNSKLGWLVVGSIKGQVNNMNEEVYCNFTRDIDAQLTRFWETEEIPSTVKALSEEEKQCESHFIENTTRLENGKFCVKLPLKNPPEVLGESYSVCKRQLAGLERRFSRQPELYELYKEFIDEYEELGHLSVIEPPVDGNYLPHHPVIKEHAETTRLRVVFNAAQPTSTGYSLNNILMVGPVVQDDLFSILIRFRQHAFVFTGDIEKMYRMIEIHPSQRKLQLILWKEQHTNDNGQHKQGPPLGKISRNDQTKCLQLNTVTYGTASAPYLSTRCLVQLGRDCMDEKARQAIEHDFYVDDCLTGLDDEQELQQLYNTVTKVLGSAGFKLHKVRSNTSHLSDSNTQKTFQLNDQFNTLGMKWQPTLDKLSYAEIDDKGKDKPVNKRVILSESSKIFDPLGLLSPGTILFKMLLQQLWLKNVDWDDDLPADIQQQWGVLKNNLKHVYEIDIPRHVICMQPIEIQLHTFADASSKAIAAAVYVRSADSHGNVKTQLLCAKTKVAPLKTTTIPRLELCAAVLGARLCKKARAALRCEVHDCIMWSDSKIVLCWLKIPENKLKTYVANRISLIKDSDSKSQWRHVPSVSNPADLASRGVQFDQLKHSTLWWEGPSFLKENINEWPSQYIVDPVDIPEVKACTIQTKTDDDVIDFKRFSKLSKLKRTIAYVNRFLYNYVINPKNKRTGCLTTDELNLALTQIIRKAQRQSFDEDIRKLSKGEKLNSKSSLLPLNPYLDSESILRVGGRLDNSDYTYAKKHPIILNAKHYVCKLLFENEHQRLIHAGPQLLLASVREEFWPIGGRALARKTYQKCMICSKIKGNVASQLMGNLPKERIMPGFPFEVVATDYAGPFYIASKKGRGCKILKTYLCIFVCFKTKAVHLEQVSDLTTKMFLLTLKRFMARRGKPRIIYSDNGKNYVGASREIGNFLKQNCNSVTESMADEAVRFKFSPAYSPHHGGLHESVVKSAKFHIRRIMGQTHLTFEELSTLFAQIEAILNSRPLYPLSSDPNDLSCLTPGHFLIGRPLTALPENSNTDNINKLERYFRIEQLRHTFWERWSKEYLAELQHRSKWRTEKPSPQLGQLVLIKEDGVPPLRWHMGRIHRLLVGSDGLARVAEILTTKGIIVRAYNRICPLPIMETDTEEETPEKGTS